MTTLSHSLTSASSLLSRLVIAVLIWHLLCLGGMQIICGRFQHIFADLLGENTPLPIAARFFITVPNLTLLAISLLFVVWVVLFNSRISSRRHGLILLVMLIGYTALLATLCFVSISIPYRNIFSALS